MERERELICAYTVDTKWIRICSWLTGPLGKADDFANLYTTCLKVHMAACYHRIIKRSQTNDSQLDVLFLIQFSHAHLPSYFQTTHRPL